MGRKIGIGFPHLSLRLRALSWTAAAFFLAVSADAKGTGTGDGQETEKIIEKAVIKKKVQESEKKAVKKSEISAEKTQNALLPKGGDADITMRVIDGEKRYFYSGNDVKDIVALNEKRAAQMDKKLADLRARLGSAEGEAKTKLQKSIAALESERGKVEAMADKYRAILKKAEALAPPEETDGADSREGNQAATTNAPETAARGTNSPASNNPGPGSPHSNTAPADAAAQNTPLSAGGRREAEEARVRLEESNLNADHGGGAVSGASAIGAAWETGAERLAASALPAERRSASTPFTRRQRRGGESGPADPKTPGDLLLASMSGFGPVFKAHEVKAVVGPGGATMLLRKDGTPASPSEIASLQTAIAAQPQALVKRPDFFAVLPRERFNRLKAEYAVKGAPQSPSFRHVGLLRDFTWTQSCQGLSGDCNPHAASLSYTKDEFISPEDLDAILEGLEEERGEDEVDVNVEYARAKLGRRRFDGREKGGFMSRFMDVFSGAADFISGADAPQGSGAVSVSGIISAGRDAPASARGARGVVPKDGSPLPPPEPDPGRKHRRLLLWIACLSAAGALLVMGLRRRRD